MYCNQPKRLTMSSAGPNNTLLSSSFSLHIPRLNDIMTHWTPFPLNSSAIAFPLARINLLLNVDAALIPGGKPVTFFVKRIPAGPSLKHNEGMPRRGTGVVSPTHRPKGIVFGVKLAIIINARLYENRTIAAELARAFDNPYLFTQCHLCHSGVG